MLRRNRTIVTLNLESNSITTGGMLAIAAVLLAELAITLGHPPNPNPNPNPNPPPLTLTHPSTLTLTLTLTHPSNPNPNPNPTP